MIVEHCLDLDPAERDRFIAERCAATPTLRAKVERMLAMDQTRFKLLPTEASDQPPAWIEAIPNRIGPFRIVETIGQGGMGIVVRGERDDGVFTQTVAIKLIRADLGDLRARERFAQERRILARLSHPAIARIIDGGSHEGRPYLVMDHVDGLPVTIDLARRKAGLGTTLDVFEQICDAVRHAHVNLVVHADIKPSNVIVTPDGAVKLLDFGIARLIADLDHDEVDGPYPLTRGYAAPERAGGAAPTVAADIFSLAVLLHEMLTGALPSPDGAPMSASAGGGPVPARRLVGDLDAIVARALSPDPADRYPDVTALLEDVRRHREQFPVRARQPGLRYRTGLFVARNRLAVMLGAAIFLLLAAASAISLALYIQARRQHEAAESRFGEVRSLANFQLFDLYDQLAEVPGTTAARARLAAEGQLYLDRLAALPEAPASVRLDVAAGLNRLASVQGVPRIPNLGRAAEARANLERAAILLDALRVELPGDPAVALESGRNFVLRAQIATWLDFQAGRARALLAQAEAQLRGAAELGTRQREVEMLRRSARLDLLGWEEKFGESRIAADAMLAWLSRWPAGAPWADRLIGTADALNARGDAHYYLGNRVGALADYQRAEALLAEGERRAPGNSALLARRLISGYNVATTLSGLGRDAEIPPLALALVQRSARALELEANDDALRRRHIVNREFAAQTLAGVGRYQEAIREQRPLITERAAIARRLPGEPQPMRDLAFSRSVLGTLYWRRSMTREACREWRAADTLLTPLERTGRLNAYDRTRTLAYVRFNLEICRGARPRSAFRYPD